jgi:hypothetical protein
MADWYNVSNLSWHSHATLKLMNIKLIASYDHLIVWKFFIVWTLWKVPLPHHHVTIFLPVSPTLLLVLFELLFRNINMIWTWVWFLAEASIFLFVSASRLALGPTQPLSQWIGGLLPCRQINQIMKLTTHPHLVPRLRMHVTFFTCILLLHLCAIVLRHRLRINMWLNFIFVFCILSIC